MIGTTIVLTAGIVSLVLADQGSVNKGDRDLSSEQRGFAGGVALGVALEIKGVRPDVLTFRMEEPAKEAILRVDSRPPVIDVHVSALLNFESLLLAARPRVTLDETDGVLPIEFPALEDGRHCLLVAVVEEAGDVHGKPFHSNVTVFEFLIGASRRDHCEARPSPYDYEPVDAPAGSGCHFPLLSPSPHELPVRGHIEEGEAAWALVPSCGGEVVAGLIRSGQLQGGEDQVPPFTVRSRRSAGYVAVRLPELPPGPWNLVAVHLSDEPIVADVSDPFYIRLGG